MSGPPRPFPLLPADKATEPQYCWIPAVETQLGTASRPGLTSRDRSLVCGHPFPTELSGSEQRGSAPPQHSGALTVISAGYRIPDRLVPSLSAPPQPPPLPLPVKSHTLVLLAVTCLGNVFSPALLLVSGSSGSIMTCLAVALFVCVLTELLQCAGEHLPSNSRHFEP